MADSQSTGTELYSTTATIQLPIASSHLSPTGGFLNWRDFGLLLQSATHALYKSLPSVRSRKLLRMRIAVTMEYGYCPTVVVSTPINLVDYLEKSKLST